MPPKKDKKDKGKKKAPVLEPPSQIPQVDPGTKACFLHQIDGYREKIFRYQKRCDKLEQLNYEVGEKIIEKEKDKRDLVEYWKREFALKVDELASKSEKLLNLQHLTSNEREDFRLQLQDQRSQFQDMKDTLSTEVNLLTSKLAMLEDFAKLREELLANMAKMEIELLEKDDENRQKVYQVEKKALIQQDLLKKDMVKRINNIALEFRTFTNKQMTETTKRTIRENVAMSSQLSKMSDKIITLIQENDDLKKREISLNRNMEMLTLKETEFSKRHIKNMDIIQSMAKGSRHHRATITHLDHQEEAVVNLNEKAEVLVGTLEDVREQLEQAQNDNTSLRNDNTELSTEFKKQIDENDQIKLVIQQASEAISGALIITHPHDEDVNEDIKVAKLQRRDNMLKNLMSILDTAATVGVGLEVGGLGKQWSADNVNIIQKCPKCKAPSDVSHYDVGDAGMVPRINKKLTTDVEKVQQQRHMNLVTLSKSMLKSVGTQTFAFPMARMFANEYNKHNQISVPKQLHKYEVLGNGPRLPVPVKITNTNQYQMKKTVHKRFKVEDLNFEKKFQKKKSLFPRKETMKK